jgi:flavodoxin
MNPVVVYSSKGGNTQKVAQEIVQELNCKAIKLSDVNDFSTIQLKGYDMVFLGTWIRGGHASPEMVKFLEQLDLPDNNRYFALFMTWAGGGKSDAWAHMKVRNILQAKNQKLLSDYYKCLGKTFGFARKGHPNAEELADARKWVSNLVSGLETASQN